jgi:hypothetical protein
MPRDMRALFCPAAALGYVISRAPPARYNHKTGF